MAWLTPPPAPGLISPCPVPECQYIVWPTGRDDDATTRQNTAKGQRTLAARHCFKTQHNNFTNIK